MATYEESGVNISLGDKCSSLAYQAAKNTFVGRQGMFASPVVDDGGFSGALDMGDYYLMINSDGVGTKIMVAEMINNFTTLGYDLLAMVVDDAVCTGAETVSITNTIDVNQLEEEKIKQMMTGLERACLENKVVIAGGEIAELGKTLNGYSWNSTAVGVVEKDRMIKANSLKPGDKIIGLNSDGFRSNGFSLIRYILTQKYAARWAQEKYDSQYTWGEKVLTPSRIYSNLILKMHGRYQEKPQVNLKAVAHITGGGIAGNIERVLKKSSVGAQLNNLIPPHEMMLKLMELGDVKPEEAYKTWNMGIGMVLITDEAEKAMSICQEEGQEAQVIGEITASGLEIDFAL